MIDSIIELAFYVAGAMALASTFMVVINTHPVHALLNLVLSLLSVAMIFFTLGAPFAGALEIIVYAGAILVLFVFVVMMLNLGPSTVEQERTWLKASGWIAPLVLGSILLAMLTLVLWPMESTTPAGTAVVSAKAVGVSLFGPYLLAVELASTLLLAGLVAAYHLGRHED